MLPKVVFHFFLVLHSCSFKLHFKIFRLSSQNSPLFFVRFVLKELIQTERDYVKSLGEVVEVSLVIFTLHPLSPIIHIQILQTDLHTFPLRIS